VYGNPSLWYLLADANGLTPTDRIKAGTEIKIPNSARTGDLTSDTHRVYNESDIIGSTLPNLKTPPPPGKSGCATFLMIIVVIIVAIVAWYALPYLAGAIGAALGTGVAVSTVIAAAIIGAAASIITQGAAIALGLQTEFSWSAVGKGALTGALTAGIGEAMNGIAEAAKIAEYAQYAKVASAALAVAGEAAKQFITDGKITSWSSLVIAGVGAYAQMGGAQAKIAGDTEAVNSYASMAKTAQYVSPWLNLAETAVRNDGKLKASDWANAVGATLGTALSTGDIGKDMLSGFEPAQKKLIGNLLVGGAMAAVDRETGKDYMIHAAAEWVGGYVGNGIGQGVFGSPQPYPYAGAPAGDNGAGGSGLVVVANKREQQDEQTLAGNASGTGIPGSTGELLASNYAPGTMSTDTPDGSPLLPYDSSSSQQAGVLSTTQPVTKSEAQNVGGATGQR